MTDCTYTPTAAFRWVRSDCPLKEPRATNGFSDMRQYFWKLQQQCFDGYGEPFWRDVDVVNDQD